MRQLVWALAGVAFIFVSGCAPSEEQQAKSFADFLDQRILDKPGLHVPALTDEERRSFGRFAEDYAVLSGFQAELNTAVKDYAAKLHTVPPRPSVGEIAKYKPDFVAARDFMMKIDRELDGALARAQAARAGLKQPELVASRFSQAFERMVVAPHKVARAIIPPTVNLLDAEIAIADFVAAHQADIVANSFVVEVNNPEVRKELQSLLDAYKAKVPELNTLREKVNSVMHGG